MSTIPESINQKFLKSEHVTFTKAELEAFIQEIRRGVYRNNYETPGHFYSPIPDINAVNAKADLLFKDPPEMEVPGVQMNPEIQQQHLQDFYKMADSLPFPEEKSEKTRYFYNNHSFAYADAITLHCMMRKYKPKRIIEIGSGFSSCVMVDTNELFFNNSIRITNIEPYPDFFFKTLPEKDRAKNRVLVNLVQDVDLKIYEELEENDILFIDSSHVSKVGSDVNHEFFEIIPRLKKGVLVHVHDIFHPFEYPYDWIAEGRAMNENYILRAFLQYNETFQVLFMSNYVSRYFRQELEKNLPLFLKNSGGNFWMKKIK
jgi:predicted O-methyltransferase YrrM